MIKITIKRNTLAKIIAAVCAFAVSVALPQLFHILGKALGTGASLGAALLPMHFGVIVAGLALGPVAGLAAGVLAPLTSYALTGMPAFAMLPFMTIELGAYGLIGGLLSEKRISPVVKTALVLIGGRLIKLAACAVAVYIFGNHSVTLISVWDATVAGVAGIAVQLVLAPIAVKAVSRLTD